MHLFVQNLNHEVNIYVQLAVVYHTIVLFSLYAYTLGQYKS